MKNVPLMVIVLLLVVASGFVAVIEIVGLNHYTNGIVAVWVVEYPRLSVIENWKLSFTTLNVGVVLFSIIVLPCFADSATRVALYFVCGFMATETVSYPTIAVELLPVSAV